MPTLLRTSTVDALAAHLQEQILAGSWDPGSWLREVDLAGELGVSRNTLRQAFQALARGGLVDHVPHRGVRVKALEHADILDILRARRCLEDCALARCEDPVALGKQLAAIAGRIEAAADERAWVRLVDLDLLFHRTIVESLASRRLGRFFGDLLDEFKLAFVALDRRDAAVEPLAHVAEHREIAEAVARGDLRDARNRLGRHLDGATARLLAGLSREAP